MEPVVIKLNEPITANDEMITQITLQEPRAKHLRILPVGPISMDSLLNIAAEVSGVPPSSIDLMTAADAMAIAGVIGDFLDGGPKPGAKPSP